MRTYSITKGQRKGRRWPILIIAIFPAVAAIIFAGKPSGGGQSQTQTVVAQLSNPAVMTPVQKPKITTPLPWPSYGQAAYGVVQDGVLARSAEEAEAVPIASLAKVITALAVLKQKPLAPGEQGPAITLTEEDEALYREYVVKSGTVIQVKAGVQISQYQALQAMLLPSSNNISDTLARWAFGSIEEYNAYANNMLREIDLTDTTIADASGFSPSTKSTAADMVSIGILYMQNPVLREIALQPNAKIPFTGVVGNYNTAINKDGVVGIKVGYTEEADNTFLVADVQGEGKDDISVAAVLGARSLPNAMKDAERLLKAGGVSHDQLPDRQP